nr:protein [Spodoptera litura nucleopolyhedrovirus]
MFNHEKSARFDLNASNFLSNSLNTKSLIFTCLKHEKSDTFKLNVSDFS